MSTRFSSGLTAFGTFTSRPEAFLIVLAYAVAWAIFRPESLDWHAFATLATWLMTLVIQRSEHRDTQALHAKLDELLRADRNADTSLEELDDEEPEEVERQRKLKSKRAAIPKPRRTR